jgi:hypothetical protein
MERHLVCNNPQCLFVLDRYINGGSLDGVQNIVRRCPACGSGWSTSCPFCNQTLIVNFIQGRPHAACCGHRLQAATKVA